MMNSYNAKYTDSCGEEEITITNDGDTLRTIIRGVEFFGNSLDSLEPSRKSLEVQLSQFTLNRNELCSCCIECTIPIALHDHSRHMPGILAVQQILGDPASNGCLEQELLQVTLTCDLGQFAGTGNSGWFEGELLEIQSQLPDGVYVRACINCLYSDYSPYGHGTFGEMMCFRNLKSEYLAVQSKADFWEIHDRYDRRVQEIYLCSEFERRVPGTGYRR